MTAADALVLQHALDEAVKLTTAAQHLRFNRLYDGMPSWRSSRASPEAACRRDK